MFRCCFYVFMPAEKALEALTAHHCHTVTPGQLGQKGMQNDTSVFTVWVYVCGCLLPPHSFHLSFLHIYKMQTRWKTILLPRETLMTASYSQTMELEEDSWGMGGWKSGWEDGGIDGEGVETGGEEAESSLGTFRLHSREFRRGKWACVCTLSIHVGSS